MSRNSRAILSLWMTTFLMVLPAVSQSFRVQCPTFTITHPLTGTNCSTNPTNPGCNNTEPVYAGPTQFSAPALGIPTGTTGDFFYPKTGTVNGAIKCMQISGGDGYSTMGDGTQIFMFAFGPLSGLADIAAGRPGTQFPYIFNTPYTAVSSTPLTRGDPATTDGAVSGAAPWPSSNPPATNPLFTWNGAVGLAPDVPNLVTVTNLVEGAFPVTTPVTTAPGCPARTANTVTAWTDAPLGLPVGGQVVVTNAVSATVATPTGYAGTWTVSCVATGNAVTPDGFTEFAFQYTDTGGGTGCDTGNDIRRHRRFTRGHRRTRRPPPNHGCRA